MNLSQEKEKIKKEIDLVDDMKVIAAIKKVLSENAPEEEIPSNVLNEPMEDWEMAAPLGRTPTKEQFQKWLEREDADDQDMTPEEALAFMKQTLAERRAKRQRK